MAWICGRPRVSVFACSCSSNLLTIVVLGIIYTLVEDDRKKKLKDTERAVVAVARKCLHFFGYLVEPPENHPIIEVVWLPTSNGLQTRCEFRNNN